MATVLQQVNAKRKREIIEALCAITSDLGEKLWEKTGESYPRDCFCGKGYKHLTYQFNDYILEFIRAAIREKLERTEKKAE